MNLTRLFAGIVTVAVAAAPPTAFAHTESDLVAVAAGSAATVTLKPTHGCGDSPTVEIAIRAPVDGAEPGAVDGWTATAVSDGNGNTVLRWTGGSLPATSDGAFPVTFAVPSVVGSLLTFPSVQYCANGEQLAWINGDPQSEYPSPRLLVLREGSESAATIDDVALDAPGRDQLNAVVDIDDPNATTTVALATPATAAPATAAPATTIAAALPSTAAPNPATTAPAVTDPSSAATATSAAADSTSAATTTLPTVDAPTSAAVEDRASTTSDDTNVLPILIGVAAVVAIGGTALAVRSRRR